MRPVNCYALLALVVAGQCCGHMHATAAVGTTHQALLWGSKWALRNKTTPKDGEVWWSNPQPGWKEVYDDEWEEWFMEQEGPTGVNGVRGEWYRRMKDGYILVGGPKLNSPDMNSTGTTMRTVHSYRIPSIVEVGGVLMCVGDARYITSTDYFFTDTVAAYSTDGGKTWKTEVIIPNGRVDAHYSRVVDPTVVAKGNNIYVLVGRYNVTRGYWHNQNDEAAIADWEPFVYKGTVNVGTKGTATDVSISWERTALKSLYNFPVSGSPGTQFLGGAGGGVVTSNGTIVLPVQARNKANRVVSMILYSADDGKSWHFGEGEAGVGTSEAALTEWDGKLLISTRSDGGQGYRMIFESSDLGATWKEMLNSISRVIGNSPKRNGPGSSSGFITVTVEGVPVMLLTHPKNLKGSYYRDRLQMWMTDGNRMWHVGQVSEGDDNSAYSSLLYTPDGVLYCLHEQNIDEVYSLHLVRLVDELKSIKSTALVWKAQDELLLGNCLPGDKYDPGCDGIPTAGLAGLLVGPLTEKTWPDAYRCVNAATSGAVSTAEGVRLDVGGGGHVVWPVSEQGQDQRYYFTNSEFTLAVTVRFDEMPRGELPLLGFVNHKGKVNKILKVSLSGVEWLLAYGNEYNSTAAEPLSVNESHQVVLTLHDGIVSLHVDGGNTTATVSVRVASPEELLNIHHLFVGTPVDGGAKEHANITVSNVLVYNRPLRGVELLGLFANRGRIRVPGSDNGVLSGGCLSLCYLLLLVHVLMF
ncbi:unnamed protein product [Trypanosoma congolense IL3000]|uniref:WGS project CAEQ00000000 data, annotated contig 1730 n=1 Tax=Trypanosoma congolense (strain IL3000) TaxID=1068625 RepID=F9W8D6_TRYCI|nr:unnamed protein product [Trypanosoma congolense IL3000]